MDGSPKKEKTGNSHIGGMIVLPPAGHVSDKRVKEAWVVEPSFRQKSADFCNIFRLQGFRTYDDMIEEKVHHSYTVCLIGNEGTHNPISIAVKAAKGNLFDHHYATVWQGDGDTAPDIRYAWEIKMQEYENIGHLLDTGTKALWKTWDHAIVDLF